MGEELGESLCKECMEGLLVLQLKCWLWCFISQSLRTDGRKGGGGRALSQLKSIGYCEEYDIHSCTVKLRILHYLEAQGQNSESGKP